MPPDWAASGTQLVIPQFDISFGDTMCEDASMNNEKLLGGQRPFRTAEPLSQPKFISINGEEVVDVKKGAYSMEARQPECLRYSFRFCVDFPNGAKRNDVELPAEKVFFTSICWIKDETLMEAVREKQGELQKELDETKQKLDRMKEKSKGFLKQTLMMRPSILLGEKRSLLERKLRELEVLYPLRSDMVIDGPNNLVFAKEGYMSVKRLRGILGREEYHWIGKFTIKNFLVTE
eukprot:CAMPEP_0202447848 /NCGR_PEP_ID=MMETSP1360-20130828/6611_1 /ASSEMBLY_ACC=CAM_ASM_000848 /TAXON_ID=515479 /ORGANISM="Licmophora paradoxa, Strain CCMP2313" /LENGTH=233 /DNA_ID=CAMNT_0049065117 /DNA_START=190 /DNA_END=891 /DNA_ORIENTATION=-